MSSRQCLFGRHSLIAFVALVVVGAVVLVVSISAALLVVIAQWTT